MAVGGIPAGPTQSDIFVAQLAQTNPSLFRQAFPQAAGIPPQQDRIANLATNPLLTGSSIDPSGLFSGAPAGGPQTAAGGFGGGFGGGFSPGQGLRADDPLFSAQLQAFDAKYGGIFALGSSMSTKAQLLNQKSQQALAQQQAGFPGSPGSGLGAFGILSGLGTPPPGVSPFGPAGGQFGGFPPQQGGFAPQAQGAAGGGAAQLMGMFQTLTTLFNTLKSQQQQQQG